MRIKPNHNAKIITVQEWANFTGVSKNTMLSYIQKYKLLFEFDPRDIYSILKFHEYLKDNKKPK
jgi:hypothetical protein